MALVYWLCIGAAALCLIYGIVNWNKTGLPGEVLGEDEPSQGGKRS